MAKTCLRRSRDITSCNIRDYDVTQHTDAEAASICKSFLESVSNEITEHAKLTQASFTKKIRQLSDSGDDFGWLDAKTAGKISFSQQPHGGRGTPERQNAG